jgi:hypothetical protein
MGNHVSHLCIGSPTITQLKNRSHQRFSRKTKNPELAPRAFCKRLKQLAYLEMKSQTAAEVMELEVGVRAGLRVKCPDTEAHRQTSKENIRPDGFVS